MTTAGTALARLDRPWQPATVVTVLGPIRGLTAARVNRRWSELLAALPATSWLRDAAEPVATEVEVADLDRVAIRIGLAPCSGVRVLVRGDTVAVAHTHALGDGRCSRRLVHDLVTEPGAPLTLPTLRPASYRTVLAAAAAHWRHSPGRIRDVVAGLRERRALGVCEADVEPELVLRRLGAGDQARLHEMRDRDRPDASCSAYLLERLLAELAARGIDIVEVHVPVDLRRYIPGGEHLGGNLAGIQRLAGTPDAMTDRWQAALRSGEPLARFLLSHVRYAVHPASPRGRAGCAAANLGWSDRGHVPEWADLPWAAGARHLVAGVAPVWGRRIGVHLTRVGDTLHVACAVNTAAFASETVAAALDACLPCASRPHEAA